MYSKCDVWCVCVHLCFAGEQIRKRRCKAAFSYVPQHEDELELKIGDVIEIIAEVRMKVLELHVFLSCSWMLQWTGSLSMVHDFFFF